MRWVGGDFTGADFRDFLLFAVAVVLRAVCFADVTDFFCAFCAGLPALLLGALTFPEADFFELDVALV